MIRRSGVRLVTLLLSLGMVAVGCSEDGGDVPSEPITPNEGETPAAPSPGPSDVGQSQATRTIYFAFDDYTLNTEAQESLNNLSEFMRAQSSAVVQIEGHCDERGSNEYNLALGERRAQSVKNYLVQMGVDPSRLPTISYGEEKPVAVGSSESAWSQNRRAEFVVSTP